MTNDTLKVIHNRRSIRQFKREQIRDADLEEILKAAVYAPSAMNQQAWHFSVVQNPVILDKIRAKMKANMLKYGSPYQVERASAPGFIAFHGAPTVIIISGDVKAEQIQIDCGITAENICLAAESLGLGSCILTSSEILFAEDNSGELKKELAIPEGYKHFCSVALGYKNCEDPQPAPRREGLITYLR